MSVMMCDLTLDCHKKVNEGRVLKVGRSPHFNVRQYVNRLDQFICMLELNQILFPANTGTQIKRDFRNALKCTKSSVNNLKSKLFCLSNSNKLDSVGLAAMRFKRKKRGVDLSFPNKFVGPSRFVTNSENNFNNSDSKNSQKVIGVDIEKDIEIIDISEDRDEAMEAAISLITLRDGIHENSLNKQKEKPILPIKTRTTQELHLKQNVTACNKLPEKYGQKLQLMVDVTSPSVKSIQTLDLKPILDSMKESKNKGVPHIVKIGNTSYTIEEIDFEIVQHESTIINYVRDLQK